MLEKASGQERPQNEEQGKPLVSEQNGVEVKLWWLSVFEFSPR